MRKGIVLGLFFFLLITVNSCEEEKKDEAYVLNMANFFSKYLATLCDSSSRCTSGFVSKNNALYCPDIILNNPFAFNGFHKKENVFFRHKFEMMVSAENIGWTTVDMGQATECFNVISEMEPCNPLDVQLLDIPECARVFNGTKFLKQECFQDEECDFGWCDVKGGRCPGNCVEYKEPNQSCNSSLDRCAPGYVCRSSGCSKASNGQPGDPCANDDDCSSFLFCRKTGSDAIGNCFKRKSEGEPCLEAKECVVGLSCVSNQCTRSRISDQVGAPCGVQQEKDEDGNFIVLECNRFSKLECGLTNTCQKLSNDANMPCAYSCDRGLYCDSGQCRFQGTIGRQCKINEECVTLYCFNNVCANPECLTSEAED